MRRLELNILFLFTRAVLFFAVPPYISDLSGYESYARNLIPGGRIPYRDWDFEYPPLAYLLISIPVWLHDWLGFKDTETTRLFFGACILPFDQLLFQAFLRRPPFAGSAFAYILLTSCMGLLLFDRFDLVLGFLLAWPFLSLRPVTQLRLGIFWGLGAGLKLVPLILTIIPARLLCDGWRQRLRGWLAFTLVLVGPFLLSCLIALVLAGGKISFLSHHAQRGVQIESLVGSVVMFLQSFFQLFAVKVDSNFGAQHLSELPGVVNLSRLVFYGMLLLSLAGVIWQRARLSVLSATWLLILSFVIFGYVLSPQFLLWLIPLGLCAVAELDGRRRKTVWLGIFTTAVALTGLHFRYYWDYVNFQHRGVLLLLTRNIALLLLWGLSWAWLRRARDLQLGS